MADRSSFDADDAALQGLRDLGMDMAHLIVARAKADAEDGLDIDRTPAFERVSRGVRRAIHLRHHIAHHGAQTRQNGIRLRQQLIRDVEDATVRHPKAEQDALAAELVERLDDPEFDDDLGGLTIAQASQRVRRDFGLGEIFTHKRRTPADIRALTARARHSAHAAALPDHPDAAMAAFLRHEAHLRHQT